MVGIAACRRRCKKRCVEVHPDPNCYARVDEGRRAAVNAEIGQHIIQSMIPAQSAHLIRVGLVSSNAPRLRLCANINALALLLLALLLTRTCQQSIRPRTDPFVDLLPPLSPSPGLFLLRSGTGEGSGNQYPERALSSLHRRPCSERLVVTSIRIVVEREDLRISNIGTREERPLFPRRTR